MVEREKFDHMEERLRVIEGGGNYAFVDMAELCLVPNVVIYPKFKVPKKLKNTSRFKRKVEFKNQDSRIKLQESRSRFKIQESREDLIKISMKRIFQKLSSTWIFLKTCLPKSFYSLVIDYQIAVINYQ